MTEFDNYLPLDDTVYPVESVYDAVQDKYIHLDDFYFNDAIWDTAIPRTPFEMQSLYEKMNNIENEVKQEDLQKILEDIKPDLFAKKPRKKKVPKKEVKKATKKSQKKNMKKKSQPVHALEENEECIFQVEKIIAHYGDWDELENMQFKIRWLGYDESEDTWEPFSHLENCIKKLEEYCERIE